MQPQRRVTVVEDDENVAGLLELMLRLRGFATSVVRDGRAALELVRDAPPPDVVVLDQLLPYCDGLAVASAIRAEPRWAGVPIVLLRSMASPDPRREPLVDASFSKPFDPDALVESLRSLVKEAA